MDLQLTRSPGSVFQDVLRRGRLAAPGSAVVLSALVATAIAASVPLAILDSQFWISLVPDALALSFAATGLVIARRQPRNGRAAAWRSSWASSGSLPSSLARSPSCCSPMASRRLRAGDGSSDRRFNRSRYDGDATLTTFHASLSNAVDVDTVERLLLGAVCGALQPAHASIGIRSKSG
jgi:hypothetical protein